LIYLKREQWGLATVNQARARGNHVDHGTRMRAQATAIPDGIPLELGSLLMPYGRDRRVALRIERMPHRARLSRGRNNGDGTWSLTRDEVEGLEYLPPKGATGSPTLMIRVVGLDSDNGTTLSVLDYPVLPGEADSDISSEGAEVHASRHEDLRNLRGELAKTKAALRTLQSELEASRKFSDADLEERLNEAAAEAASALEERRAAWQAETRDRLAKAEARAQERFDQARQRWELDAEGALSRSEEAWKSAEAARLAEAESRWREQSGRALAKETAQLRKIEGELGAARNRVALSAASDTEIQRLNDQIAKLQMELAERDNLVAEAQTTAMIESREQARRDLAAAMSQAEEKWKAAEARRRSTAEAAWKELSDRAVEEVKHRLDETENELLDARSELRAARERHDPAETKKLRAELSNAVQTIAVREKELGKAQAAADQAVAKAEELASAAGKAEAAWKKEEAKRLAAAERRWNEQSTQIIANQADTRGEELARAVGNAEAAWKNDEAKRLAAAEKQWREQSVQAVADVTAKLQHSEAALAKLHAELQETKLRSTRNQRDDGEIRRLNEALAQSQARLSRRQAELAEIQTAADETLAQARRESDQKLAQAKEEWSTQEAVRLADAQAEWKAHSDRLFKQATIRLEGAEAALAEARAAAGTAQDRRESADLKRLRTEFSAARETLAERDAELAEARVAVSRERERNRDDVDAALAKAEESWKAAEEVHLSEVETRERERGGRALAEAMGRLERTEAALTETRGQLESERERGVVSLAETRSRLEKTESLLHDARNQIENMRDPANEAEIDRLRADLASSQIMVDERDAELADIRANARRSREDLNTRVQAAVMRARDEWQVDEHRRMEAAHRQWESDARLKGAIEFGPDLRPEQLDEQKKDKRLAIDIALAAALAVVVVVGVTFYPMIVGFVTGAPGGSSIGMTKAAAAVHPGTPASPALPHAVVSVSAVKLRVSPSADAHAVTTIMRGFDVTLLGQTGSWTHIRTGGEDGKTPSDGWVHTSSLKQISGTPSNAKRAAK
jgi:hypothetical protein